MMSSLPALSHVLKRYQSFQNTLWAFNYAKAMQWRPFSVSEFYTKPT